MASAPMTEAGGCSSREPTAPTVLLTSHRVAYASGADLGLTGALLLPRGAFTLVSSSTLVLSEAGSGAVRRQHDAFHLSAGTLLPGTLSGTDGWAFADLAPGHYSAVWEIVTGDGEVALRSNRARFELDPGWSLAASAPLRIELPEFGDPRREPEHLIAQLTNRTLTSIELIEALESSALWLGEVRYPHCGLIAWAGPSELVPGRSWAAFLAFSDYGVRELGGAPRVAFEMGGLRSEAIDLPQP
jgi:hypothetical protein